MGGGGQHSHDTVPSFNAGRVRRTCILRIFLSVETNTHRIIDDRIEKSMKGRRIGNNRPGPHPSWLHSYTIWLLYRPGSTHRPPPLCVHLPSAKTFFIAAILLWENDNIGILLIYSVIYNSVVVSHEQLGIFLTLWRSSISWVCTLHNAWTRLTSVKQLVWLESFRHFPLLLLNILGIGIKTPFSSARYLHCSKNNLNLHRTTESFLVGASATLFDRHKTRHRPVHPLHSWQAGGFYAKI